MTDRIAVLASAPAYVGLKHPIDGPLKETGSLWTYDGFTCRMLVDGVIVREPSAQAPPAQSEPDAAAEAQAG